MTWPSTRSAAMRWRLHARSYAESGAYAANDALKLVRRFLAQADQWSLVPQGFNPASAAAPGPLQ